ncbi:hypothetical protein BDQ17DRAFT_1351470 [Cyathus striatus]|nr:hypothetical protein BDQ17DRAFT_1351470 [Cyathus striatus]
MNSGILIMLLNNIVLIIPNLNMLLQLSTLITVVLTHLLSLPSSYAIPTLLHVRDNTPQRCHTNVTLPSFPERCYSMCNSVRDFQRRCGDTIPCMCQHAPPISLSTCIECVVDAAGDLLSQIPGYLNETTNRLQSYSSACDALPRNLEETALLPSLEWCPSVAITTTPSLTLIRVSKAYPYIPYLSFSAALLLVLILNYSKRL